MSTINIKNVCLDLCHPTQKFDCQTNINIIWHKNLLSVNIKLIDLPFVNQLNFQVGFSLYFILFSLLIFHTQIKDQDWILIFYIDNKINFFILFTIKPVFLTKFKNKKRLRHEKRKRKRRESLS